MSNGKPKYIRSDIDDLKLAAIEHLTGERLVRRKRNLEVLPGIATAFAAMFFAILLSV